MLRKRRLKNSTSELEQLKGLLLGKELEQLKELETKLEALHFESYNKKTIVEKVTPLFDEILLKRLESDGDETIKIFSKYIARIMHQASQDAPEELSEVLQETISEAISKEIANNKESVIDALYPVMGGMISKYVTQSIKEMMENINEKIESGLSFDKYKRKLKSKITGVSEAEMLLEESSDAIISSLFVIHKESGLLITEAHLKDQEIDDPHMVASMASAIKDFVNDWVQSHEEQSEVQILSYGNATLYIESAGSVYVVAFLDTEPDYEQRLEINAFFASIVKKYADFFQKFDGDDTAEEIQTLSQRMHDHLNRQEMLFKDKKEKSAKNPIKYILYFLGLTLTAYIIYLLNGWYFEYSLERKINEQTGQEVGISRKNGRIVLQGHVDSTKTLYEIEKIITKENREPIHNNLLIPMKQIDKMIKAQKIKSIVADELNEKILSLQKDLNKSQSHFSRVTTSINDEFKNSINVLNKEVSFLQEELNSSKSHFNAVLKNRTEKIEILKKEKNAIQKVIEVKQKIVSKLDKTFVNEIFYNREDSTLDFKNINLFSAGKVIYNETSMAPLQKSFEKYITILGDHKEYIESITVEGHTDSSGVNADNVELSQKRALFVMNYLLALDIVKQYRMQSLMHAEGKGSKEVINVNGIEDKEASRRIKIKFKLKESRMLENIEKIVND